VSLIASMLFACSLRFFSSCFGTVLWLNTGSTAATTTTSTTNNNGSIKAKNKQTATNKHTSVQKKTKKTHRSKRRAGSRCTSDVRRLVIKRATKVVTHSRDVWEPSPGRVVQRRRRKTFAREETLDCCLLVIGPHKVIAETARAEVNANLSPTLWCDWGGACERRCAR
jgi:hypothetical protein